MKVHIITQELMKDYGGNFSNVISRTEVDTDSTQAVEAIAAMYGVKIFERHGKHFFTQHLDTQRILYVEYTVEA